MRKFIAILCGLICLNVLAGEVIPSVPSHYFNDYAGVASGATAAQLDRQLEQFERDSSCQIVVAVYPKMQSDSSIEDYTVRVAQAWKVGQKDKNNGAVLFVFIQDRKMFLQTGYGLEGVMPDAICKRIIEDEIKPWFKSGNYDAGLTAGVNAILAAAKGEYKGNGQTAADRNIILVGHGQSGSGGGPEVPVVLVIIGVIIFAFIVMSMARRGWYYSGSGWSGGGWSSGGGGWSSGGSSGGGFSSGGGSFGGGGAGGSW